MLYMIAPNNDFLLAVLMFTIGVAITWLAIYGFKRKDINKKHSNKSYRHPLANQGISQKSI